MIDLVCLTFAGGNKYSYTSFTAYTDSAINLVTLELPGRGKRFEEALETDIHKIVDDLFSQLKEKVIRPYAIFGHSMGAVMTYLLAHKITASDFTNPMHLIVSGCRAPRIKREPPYYHDLPKAAFIEKIRHMGGCPDEILNDETLLSLFEPALRADFKAVESYQYEPKPPLVLPFTVLLGTEDRVTLEQAKVWQEESTFDIELKQFEGNHFFIFEHRQEIIQMINQKLKAKLLLNNY